jgi:hypothetical protein
MALQKECTNSSWPETLRSENQVSFFVFVKINFIPVLTPRLVSIGKDLLFILEFACIIFYTDNCKKCNHQALYIIFPCEGVLFQSYSRARFWTRNIYDRQGKLDKWTRKTFMVLANKRPVLTWDKHSVHLSNRRERKLVKENLWSQTREGKLGLGRGIQNLLTVHTRK